MGKQYRCVSMVALSALPTVVAAIDLQPGEVEPQPAGTQMLQFVYGDVERKGAYSNGRLTNPAAKVQADLYQMRYVRYFELGDMPASVFVQQPWGTLHVEGLGATKQRLNGHGDTVFLLAAWPYVDRERKTYFAVGGYLFANNGSYDSRNSVNHGENRQRTALQAAYQTRVASELDWAIAVDVLGYGENSAYGTSNARLRQDYLYTLQSNLKYRLDSNMSIGMALFHTFGGETMLNGVSRNDAQRTDRYLLTGAYALPALRSVVQLQYGRDLAVQNGLRETHRMALRVSHAF